VAKTTHPTAKMSEELNMKCRQNTMVQRSTPYTNLERHNAQCHKQTDWRQYDADRWSYCTTVRSAKTVQY